MFYLLAGLGLGFFDGCIGAGAGAFWAAAFVVVLLLLKLLYERYSQ